MDASAHEYARHLMQLLPVAFPAPEIYLEPDGDAAIEWDLGKRRILSVSISRNGTVTYAGLFGNTRIHGVERLDDAVPRALREALARLADSRSWGSRHAPDQEP